MSFTVYTGIKFRTKSIEKAVNQLKSIREQALKNMAKSLLHGHNYIGLASKMGKYLKADLRKYKEDPSEMNLLRTKLEIVRELHRLGDDTERARLRGELDYPFEVMIYPYHGNLYGNFFGTNYGYGKDENVDLLMTIVDEYWYGDQGDPDPNLTWRQWQQRSKVWNGIFDVYDTPRENGISFMVAKWDWIDYKDIPDELVEKLSKLDIIYKEDTDKDEYEDEI